MRKTLAVLKQVRAHYLAQYRLVLDEYLQQHRPGSAEVLFELPRPERPYAYRLYRADMASSAESDIAEVNPDTYVKFDPFSDRGGPGLELSVRPVAWNGLEFHCEGELPEAAALEPWCIKWLDLDETGLKGDDGLLGAIHSVTPPKRDERFSTFSVDFGSAPVRAVAELFALLRGLGVARIELSSSCLGTIDN
jgi:hypothetical protein